MLKQFNLDADVFSAIAEMPEAFETTGRTTTLHVGRRVPFKGSINGIEVSAYATLKSALLTRLSVIKQESPSTGNMYKIVTGIMKPVEMDLEVVIDGQTLPLHEVLRSFVNESSKNQVSEEEFLATCARIGLKFNDGMPLFFQHFGADDDKIEHAFDVFASKGAVDVFPQMQNKGRITRAYAHAEGVPVSSFEVGTVDREQSRTNQGFLNLIDASVDQFTRIVRYRKEAKVLRGQIDSATNWSQEKIKASEEKFKELMDISRQWSSNWAGAQQIIKIGKDGQKEYENKYAAVNLPCGRFTLDGEAIDVWRTSARAENADEAVVTKTSATSSAEVSDDELPF